MKTVILDTTFNLTVKSLYSLVRHTAILIIVSRRSIVEINSAVNMCETFDKNVHKGGSQMQNSVKSSSFRLFE